MKTEREMFESWAADQDLDITIVDFSSCVKLVDHNGKSRMFCYEEFDTDIAWKSWQASASREGYKLVPVEPSEKMYITGVDKRQSGGNTADVYKAMIGAAP